MGWSDWRQLFGKSKSAATAPQLPDDVRLALLSFRHAWLPHGVPPAWVTLHDTRLTLTLPFVVVPEVLHHALQQLPELEPYQLQLFCQPEIMANSKPDWPQLYGNVILVASGKGGVGKSSVTVSLALALAQLGARVGIFDADIYGPSLPTMMGGERPEVIQQGGKDKLQTVARHGVSVSSLGYLIEPEEAAIWRGPMAAATLQKLFKDSQWPRLDYLLVDMPPGTGDIQLTFAEQLPVTAAVVVTTPQTVALADAEKGIRFFHKLQLPIVGLVENMSYYACEACGHQASIFGSDGGAHTALKHEVPLLGQWPLLSAQRDSLDCGEPLQVTQPQHPFADIVRDSAASLSAQLYWQKTMPKNQPDNQPDE